MGNPHQDKGARRQEMGLGMSEPGYIPPHSIEHELAVIGCAFIEPHLIGDSGLKPADFWRDRHQIVWRAMLTVQSSGHEVDWLTTLAEIKRAGQLDLFGGYDSAHAYLREISNDAASAYGFEHYAAIVKDAATKREAIRRASDIRQLALDDTRTADDVVAQFASDASELMDSAVTTPDLDGAALMDELEHEYANPPQTISTTYNHLDVSGRFVLGSLNVISARPGQGKSTLAACMAQRMLKAGVKVGVVALEMDRRQFGNVMVASRADASRNRLRDGKCFPDELDRVKSARDEMRQSLRISDRSMTVEQIGSLCRRWQRRDGVQVVFIDHLQRITPTDSRQDQVQNIAHITWALANLARSTGLVLVMGAQLNREAEKDKGTVQQRHLKGGGTIEEDASMVIQIKVDEASCQPNDSEWVMELVKVKDRYGSLARCPIRFFKATGRMVEIDGRQAIVDQFNNSVSAAR